MQQHPLDANAHVTTRGDTRRTPEARPADLIDEVGEGAVYGAFSGLLQHSVEPFRRRVSESLELDGLVVADAVVGES